MRQQLTIAHLTGTPGLVLVDGEVDINTTPELYRQLCHAAEMAAGESGATVRVDLAAVSFIDARGLEVLVVAQAHAWVRGVRMLFTRLSPSTARLVQITGQSLNLGEDLTEHPFQS
jgi:anti-anti-sigma factor